MQNAATAKKMRELQGTGNKSLGTPPPAGAAVAPGDRAECITNQKVAIDPRPPQSACQSVGQERKLNILSAKARFLQGPYFFKGDVMGPQYVSPI